MLKCDIEYLIHVSDQTPKFVTVYRPILPWELWPDRTHVEHGKLKLLSGLSYGSEDIKKFSEENLKIVSDYTEAENEARRFAIELGLIC
jgi:hypothetical protein